ncbi:integral membrane sensor signal transduction histidine kinase [Serratia sp. AS12]|uniref:ATP-binding protein n=1 Tax=Serratia TaxID=613 RepID=UPI00020E9C41|nr:MULTISPECIES: ATP-binding protein [Serratia]AEF47218.1 integral membrane sensor signal transduction histidine kinase [Serratia plymuthica AS9]AEF52170.1 integral membrane sensor signal transduction histidine kinase [Serratia sp. AS12]AEG29877.1 integral membrane sensor signal transduction histidine kinase [Serratia sp. AS13]UTN95902.1 ATP-binding protein [Serratia plymuthica]
MISFKSFFIRTIVFQVMAILVLWGILLGWVKYLYYPDAEKYLDNQQRLVARGIANILDKTDITGHNYVEIIKDIEIMYIDSIKNGMQDEIDYRPLFLVYDHNNQMIYASPPQEKPLSLPPSVLSGTISYANVKWHIAGSWSDKQRFRVIVGESFDNRTTIFGNPAESTAIPLLVVLAAIIVTLLITAYFSLRPLRQIARMISDRKPGNLSPISVREQYQEIRPVVLEINKLMTRIDAANQREKRFMADAAHELRTPIAAVLAQLHLLTQVADKTERQEIIEDMQQGLDRAASLSRQLIDLAKLESENFPLKIEAVDIHAEISKCLAQHVPYALEKNVELSLDGSENVVVETDRHSLIAIFTNLLDNAIKYAPAGGHIEANIRSLSPMGCYISLRDNGPGVNEEHCKRLFERFYRVPGTQQIGSGLGLAIAKNLADKIGAQLRITEGLDDRGIGFVIDLPENYPAPQGKE